AAIPNQGSGVAIVDGTNNVIGGMTVGAGVGMIGGTEVPASTGGAGNVISGNAQWGIQFTPTGRSAPSSNAVMGNYIGTPAQGPTCVRNGQGRILVNTLSTQTTIPQVIGGASPGMGNLIAGNTYIGVQLLGPQGVVAGTNNVVQGNLIGLNAAGAVLGNATG